jgi:hypothetical protein
LQCEKSACPLFGLSTLRLLFRAGQKTFDPDCSQEYSQTPDVEAHLALYEKYIRSKMAGDGNSLLSSLRSVVKTMWGRTSFPISLSGAVIGNNRKILP